MNQIKLREDLSVNLIQEDDNRFIYISDPLLIAEPIALPFSYYPLIQLLLEGAYTANEIAQSKAVELLNLTKEKIHTLLTNLELLYILETDNSRILMQNMQSYLSGNLRQSYCHSFSYPENVKELDIFLENILQKGKKESEIRINAILAPHIDLRLEESWEVYANSFLPLSNMEEIDTVIMLGTAHYKSSSDFMFTKKDFSTPYGIAYTDKGLLNEIENTTEIIYDDIAHYKEHSLEFHLLFLQKLLPNKKFKILPILTGSPANYIENGEIPDSNNNYENTINAIKQAIGLKGRSVLILSSGDMSHIGRKFGDDFNAKTEIERIESEDKILVNSLVNAGEGVFFEELIKNKDKNRICGTAPFYGASRLLNSPRIINTGYNIWYEQETESLVSFAGFWAI